VRLNQGPDALIRSGAGGGRFGRPDQQLGALSLRRTRSPSDSWARCAASAWTGRSRSPGDISKPHFASTPATTTATGPIERLAWKLRRLGGAFTPWAQVHPQSSAATYSADSSTSTRPRRDRILGTHRPGGRAAGWASSEAAVGTLAAPVDPAGGRSARPTRRWPSSARAW
jgi:hypothetical protein